MNMSSNPAPGPGLPEDLARSIEGKDSGTASTLLSTHRTKLSIERTGLSEKRTGLSDLRSHLANERTHLAYLRTSISLIGFGITLNRFSVFLQQNHMVSQVQHRPMLRNTENAGSGMVIVGIALLLWALYRYWHVNQDIERGVFRPLNRAVVALTVLLIVGGATTAAWLFLQQ